LVILFLKDKFFIFYYFYSARSAQNQNLPFDVLNLKSVFMEELNIFKNFKSSFRQLAAPLILIQSTVFTPNFVYMTLILLSGPEACAILHF